MTSKLPFLSDEHHYAIAHVAARSAQLDHTIEHAINALLLGQKRTAEFVLKNLSGDRLVGLCEALLMDRFADDEAAIKDLIGRIEQSRKDRNELLHWLWGEADDPEQMLVTTLRPYRIERSSSKTAADIRAVADAMFSACLELEQWGQRAGEEIVSSLRETLALYSLLLRSLAPSGEDRPSTPELLGRPPEPSRE